ncbi:MAG: 4-alpha-glucanotransferase, partial [Actinomycetia bacterium]|nr:4-alpha-glucanotransferase [Actinomycetes bacterium]
MDRQVMVLVAGDIAPTYRDSHRRLVEIAPAVRAAVRAAAGEPVPVRAGAAIDPLPARDGRSWGWQVQLYQLRGARSWGIGDYGDLAQLASGLGALGASVILVNPLHAETPAPPYPDSPYTPSSRRFVSVASLCVPLLPEYQAAPAAVRAAVDRLAPPNAERIDRGAVWAAKLAALDLLFPGGSPERWAGGEPDAERLVEFAVFCALAREHGRDWRDWPGPARRPGPSARAAADPRAVALHAWAQLRARQQLAAAQRAARDAGMAVGIVLDLAIGVDPAGADAWAFADSLADGVTIGAPPDDINTTGQDWSLPAWRPDRLAAADFAPWREVVRAAVRSGGGLRVDHIMGLTRLWWIPADAPIGQGAYVSYDADAMFGALVDEARVGGALLIGEDLGVVEPSVRERMARAGILGTALLWFEGVGDGDRRLPARWRPGAAASVSTHDLPTAAGFLRDAQVYAQHGAGVLAEPLEQALVAARAARAEVFELLRRCGALGVGDGGKGGDGGDGAAADGGDGPAAGGDDAPAAGGDDGLAVAATDAPGPVVEAMYRALLASPSALVLVSAADAVGDLRQPNLPGTVDEYPNWRLPLADGAGAVVSLERFRASPGVGRLSALM